MVYPDYLHQTVATNVDQRSPNIDPKILGEPFANRIFYPQVHVGNTQGTTTKIPPKSTNISNGT